MWYIYVLIVLVNNGLTIDVLPCSEGVNAAGMDLAMRLLENSMPPGYRLIEIEPLSQTGRNPHRWIGRYERLDNVYNHNCDYLSEIRTAFRRTCPAGSEISQIGVCDTPNRNSIIVQYLVNCGCRKNPRKRRNARGYVRERSTGYVRERSTCSGTINFVT